LVSDLDPDPDAKKGEDKDNNKDKRDGGAKHDGKYKQEDDNEREEEPKHKLGVMGLVIGHIDYHNKNPSVEMYGGENLATYGEVQQDREDATVASCHRWEAYVRGLKHTAYGDAKASRSKEAFWRTLIADWSFDWQQRPDASWEANFEIWMRRSDNDMHPDLLRRAKIFDYYAPAVTRLMTRAIAVTDEGYFGIVPGRAKRGDSIVLLKGGTVPYVIREATSTAAKGKYEFVGECYVHGVMDGELLTDDRVKELREFWLV
jgi:hypothetical protein